MPDDKNYPWMKYLEFDDFGCLVIKEESLGEVIKTHWDTATTFCVRYDYKKSGGGQEKTNSLCSCRHV